MFAGTARRDLQEAAMATHQLSEDRPRRDLGVKRVRERRIEHKAVRRVDFVHVNGRQVYHHVRLPFSDCYLDRSNRRGCCKYDVYGWGRGE